MASFFKWDNSLEVGHFRPVPWVSYVSRFYCTWKILYLIHRNFLLFGWISFSIHGSYPLHTEISFAISWPFSLYVDHPLHETAFCVNISPHEFCLCYSCAWMKMHFWKLKLSHLTWVNEDSLLKVEVVAPYVHKCTHMIFSKFTFENWSWCPLWMNENECINMHVSDRQKHCILRVMCEMRLAWHVKMPCYILFVLTEEPQISSFVLAYPVLCWYFVSQMLHLYSLSWNKNTHLFKILFPKFYMFFSISLKDISFKIMLERSFNWMVCSQFFFKLTIQQ